MDFNNSLQIAGNSERISGLVNENTRNTRAKFDVSGLASQMDSFEVNQGLKNDSGKFREQLLCFLSDHASFLDAYCNSLNDYERTIRTYHENIDDLQTQVLKKKYAVIEKKRVLTDKQKLQEAEAKNLRNLKINSNTKPTILGLDWKYYLVLIIPSILFKLYTTLTPTPIQ
jgi:hypothetical protein